MLYGKLWHSRLLSTACYSAFIKKKSSQLMSNFERLTVWGYVDTVKRIKKKTNNGIVAG